ncbi:hypothetical protein Trydic_g11731 [Trypoxylus dichotomus]
MVKTVNTDDWVSVTTFLVGQGVQFYTCTLHSARPVKAIVKYLPSSIDENGIECGLTYKGIKVKRVVNLKRWENSASSVFMITINACGD